MCLRDLLLFATEAKSAAFNPPFLWVVALIKTVAGTPGRGGGLILKPAGTEGFGEGRIPLAPSSPPPVPPPPLIFSSQVVLILVESQRLLLAAAPQASPSAGCARGRGELRQEFPTGFGSGRSYSRGGGARQIPSGELPQA